MNDEPELVISPAASETADVIYDELIDAYPSRVWLREIIQKAINKAGDDNAARLEAAVGRHSIKEQVATDQIYAVKKMCEVLAKIPDSKYQQADISPSVGYELGRKDQASAVLSKIREIIGEKHE